MNHHRIRHIWMSQTFDTGSTHINTHAVSFPVHTAPLLPFLFVFRFWTDVSGFGRMPVPEILEVQTQLCRTDSLSCTHMSAFAHRHTHTYTHLLLQPPTLSSSLPVEFCSHCSEKNEAWLLKGNVLDLVSRVWYRSSSYDQATDRLTVIHVTSCSPGLLLFDLSLPPETESPAGLRQSNNLDFSEITQLLNQRGDCSALMQVVLRCVPL